MQNPPPFIPRALTFNIAVGITTQGLPLPKQPARGGEVRLANIGTQTVFVSFTGVATLADGMPILAGSAEVFSCPDNTVINAIASATGSTLYCTVGEGV